MTGAHRAGTTWVGRALAVPPSVGYLHEPFNPGRWPGTADLPEERWFRLVCEPDVELYRRALGRALAFRYGWRSQLAAARSGRALAVGLRDGARFAGWRLVGARPLMKDPIAAFSAEWLAETFGMTPVVVTRHPAAVAWSIKRQWWRFPFGDLVSQPRLMQGELARFASMIERCAQRRPGIVEEAAIVWVLIYSVLLRYLRRHGDWILVRHEDLVADPIEGFRRLYEALGLPFSRRAGRWLRAHAATAPAGEPHWPGRSKLVRRDPVELTQSWREQLADDEVSTVKRITEPISGDLYPETSW